MHYREDPFRMAYELRAPNHRLTPELLQHLEAAADHVTRYPPIHLSVYHMATQELHETPVCLVRERDRNELDQYSPCECHQVRCRRCGQPFMAMTEDCAEITSWNQDPRREAAKTPYHRTLEYAKGSTRLTTADCYAIAITEVFDGLTPVLHPVVKDTLDRQARSTVDLENSGEHVWTFKDGSTLESEEPMIHTTAL